MAKEDLRSRLFHYLMRKFPEVDPIKFEPMVDELLVECFVRVNQQAIDNGIRALQYMHTPVLPVGEEELRKIWFSVTGGLLSPLVDCLDPDLVRDRFDKSE